jgi:hypothetical protein
MEFGGHEVARVDVDLFSTPGHPTGTFTPPCVVVLIGRRHSCPTGLPYACAALAPPAPRPHRRQTVTLGPLDYTVIGFAKNDFNGSIAREIGKVVEAGIVRIVDLVFVTKDAAGDVDIVEFDNLDDPKFESFAPLLADRMGLFTPEDIGGIADGLPEDTSALIILWENKWAEKIKAAILDANGFLVAHARIQPELLEALNEELEAAGAA